VYGDRASVVSRTVDRIMPDVLRPFWERIRSSHIGKRLVSGAFWSTLGAGGSQSFMLLTTIIVARMLGREQFGRYGIVMTTVGMFSAFAGFGLGTTATKFVAKYKRTEPQRAGRIIALSSMVAVSTGVLASIGLLIIAPLVSEKALAAPELSGLLRLATGILFFGAINSSQIGVLAGFEAFRTIARINIMTGIASFVLVTSLTLVWGLAGSLVAQVVTLGTVCIVTNLAIRSEAAHSSVPVTYVGCMVERGVLVGFSLPAVMSGIMVTPVSWFCATILVNQPNGYAEMGIFNAAASWQRAMLFLPGAVGAVALPMLAELHGANELGQYRKALRYNVLLNGGVALAVFSVVALLSKFIMRSYGVSFEPGYSVLILLGLSAVLIAIGNVIGNAIASAGNMWFGFMFNAMWGVVYIACAAFLVPHQGAFGLGVANLAAYCMLSFGLLLYLKRL
jgi:O-antigen/teichoic acid export membrane protein